MLRFCWFNLPLFTFDQPLNPDFLKAGPLMDPPPLYVCPDGELGTGLLDACGDGCPFSFSPADHHLFLRDPGPGSALFGLQPPPLPQCSHWTSGSPIGSCLCFPGSYFYHLDTPAGRLVPDRRDCGTAVDGTESHGLHVEFGLSPPVSPPPSAVLPSHFQALGGLRQPSPVQHPRSVTQ